MKYSTSRKENVSWLVSVQFALKISKHTPTTQKDFSLLSHSQLGCIWSTVSTTLLWAGEGQPKRRASAALQGQVLDHLTDLHALKTQLWALFWLVSVSRKDSLIPLGQALWGWLTSAAVQSTLHYQMKSSLSNFDSLQSVQITTAA